MTEDELLHAYRNTTPTLPVPSWFSERSKKVPVHPELSKRPRPQDAQRPTKPDVDISHG